MRGAVWEIPGYALHQEFDLLAEAGLAPLRILQMATLNGAEFLGTTASWAPWRRARTPIRSWRPAPTRGPGRQAAGSSGVPLTVLDLAGQAWPGPALVLVRPDQCVAWTGDAAPGDPSALLDLVRGADGSLMREPPRAGRARAR